MYKICKPVLMHNYLYEFIIYFINLNLSENRFNNFNTSEKKNKRTNSRSLFQSRKYYRIRDKDVNPMRAIT